MTTGIKRWSKRLALVGAIAFVTGWLASWPIPCAEQNKDKEAGESADDKRCVSTTAAGYIWVWTGENKEPIEAFSVLLTAIFTGTLFLATVLLWKAGERQIKASTDAAKAAKASADLAIVSQRPWVSLVCSIADDIVWTDQYARIMVEFRIKNVGATPALNAFVVSSVRPSIMRPGPNTTERLRLLSLKAQEEIGGQIGSFTLFPGEERAIVHGLFITVEELETQERNFKTATRIPEGTVMGNLTAAVFAIVDYEFAFNDERHQTGVAYELWESTPHRASLNEPRPTIPKDDIRFTQDWAGFAN